jgi:hypothetical protein
MSSSGSVLLTATMIVSLFLSTVLISWFALQIYGNDLGVGIVETPRQLPTVSTANNINFAAFTNTWEHIDNLGLSSPENTLIIFSSSLYLQDIQPDATGNIKNYYVINNTIGADYKVVINEYTNTQGGNYIYVKSDGLHIPKYGGGDILYIPVVTSGENTIMTNYNVNTRAFSFSFNGKNYLATNLNILGSSSGIYGGITTDTKGLIIKTFRSDNIMGGNNESLNTFSNMVATLANLLIIAGKLVTFTLPEYIMPMSLQLILIFPQEIGLAVGLFGMARGV